MIVIRNLLGKFTEFVTADVPIIVCEEGHVGVDVLRHLDTREIVGVRVYDIAQSLLEDNERMDWLVSQHVEVRTPLVYGSRAGFVAQTLSDEEDAEHRTDLREQIDRAIAALQPQVGK